MATSFTDLIGIFGMDEDDFLKRLWSLCLSRCITVKDAIHLIRSSSSIKWNNTNELNKCISRLSSDYMARLHCLSKEYRLNWKPKDEESGPRHVFPIHKTSGQATEDVLFDLLKGSYENKDGGIRVHLGKSSDTTIPDDLYLKQSLRSELNSVIQLLEIDLSIHSKDPNTDTISTNDDKSMAENLKRVHGIPPPIANSRSLESKLQSRVETAPTTKIDSLRVCTEYGWPLTFSLERGTIWRTVFRSALIRWEVNAVNLFRSSLLKNGFLNHENPTDPLLAGNRLRESIVAHYHSTVLKPVIDQEDSLISSIHEVKLPLTWDEVKHYFIELLELYDVHWVHQMQDSGGPSNVETMSLLLDVMLFASPGELATQWMAEWLVAHPTPRGPEWVSFLEKHTNHIRMSETKERPALDRDSTHLDRFADMLNLRAAAHALGTGFKNPHAYTTYFGLLVITQLIVESNGGIPDADIVENWKNTYGALARNLVIELCCYPRLSWVNEIQDMLATPKLAAKMISQWHTDYRNTSGLNIQGLLINNGAVNMAFLRKVKDILDGTFGSAMRSDRLENWIDVLRHSEGYALRYVNAGGPQTVANWFYATSHNMRHECIIKYSIDAFHDINVPLCYYNTIPQNQRDRYEVECMIKRNDEHRRHKLNMEVHMENARRKTVNLLLTPNSTNPPTISMFARTKVPFPWEGDFTYHISLYTTGSTVPIHSTTVVPDSRGCISFGVDVIPPLHIGPDIYKEKTGTDYSHEQRHTGTVSYYAVTEVRARTSGVERILAIATSDPVTVDTSMRCVRCGDVFSTSRDIYRGESPTDTKSSNMKCRWIVPYGTLLDGRASSGTASIPVFFVGAHSVSKLLPDFYEVEIGQSISTSIKQIDFVRNTSLQLRNIKVLPGSLREDCKAFHQALHRAIKRSALEFSTAPTQEIADTINENIAHYNRIMIESVPMHLGYRGPLESEDHGTNKMHWDNDNNNKNYNI
jgi:hypothetical protein